MFGPNTFEDPQPTWEACVFFWMTAIIAATVWAVVLFR